MASFVDQIMAQAEGGSAQGQSLPIVQAFAGGRGMQMDQARLDLEKERAAMFKESQQVELANKTLLTQVNRLHLQEMQDFNASAGDIAALSLKAASNPLGHLDPAIIDSFSEIVRKRPGVLASAEGQRLMTNIQTSIQASAALDRTKKAIEDLKAQGMAPTGYKIDTKGNVLPTFADKTPVALKEVEAVNKLEDQVSATTDPVLKNILQKRLDNLREKVFPGKDKGVAGGLSEQAFVNRHFNTVYTAMLGSPESEGKEASFVAQEATNKLRLIYRKSFGTTPPEGPGKGTPAPLTAPPSSTAIQKLDTDPLGLFK